MRIGLNIQQMPPRAIFVPAGLGVGGSFSMMRPSFQPINIQAQQFSMRVLSPSDILYSLYCILVL